MKKTQEILKGLNLDWTVTQRPLYTDIVTDEGIEQVPTQFYGQFRDDNNSCLGVSSDRYHISQNSDVLDILVNYFGSNLDVKNISGGQIKGGRRIWLALQQENLFKRTTAELEQRLIIKDSHDGSSPITLGFQDKVLVCQNGMTRWIQRGAHAVRIMHTSSMSEKLKTFEKLYGEYIQLNEKKKEVYESWMSTKVSMDLAIKLIEQLNSCDLSLDEVAFKDKFSGRKYNITQAQLECMEIELTRQGSTKWGVFNGITNYTTHVMGQKKTSEQRQDLSIDRKGSGYKLNNKAFELIAAL